MPLFTFMLISLLRMQRPFRCIGDTITIRHDAAAFTRFFAIEFYYIYMAHCLLIFERVLIRMLFT